ncbi:hypothetical protein HPB50_020158 [Hyalomma asiaticum]|uniref:Uncharacterized protein n=1 Tax=Hyalomma asiaticum TaxID=266040 RepID=A0ACB7TK90_HYAAI|nr:hypothetical protein HPB50_020158 [Hyalomma asiaticum]
MLQAFKARWRRVIRYDIVPGSSVLPPPTSLPAFPGLGSRSGVVWSGAGDACVVPSRRYGEPGARGRSRSRPNRRRRCWIPGFVPRMSSTVRVRAGLSLCSDLRANKIATKEATAIYGRE